MGEAVKVSNDAAHRSVCSSSRAEPEQSHARPAHTASDRTFQKTASHTHVHRHTQTHTAYQAIASATAGVRSLVAKPFVMIMIIGCGRRKCAHTSAAPAVAVSAWQALAPQPFSQGSKWCGGKWKDELPQVQSVSEDSANRTSCDVGRGGRIRRCASCVPRSFSRPCSLRPSFCRTYTHLLTCSRASTPCVEVLDRPTGAHRTPFSRSLPLLLKGVRAKISGTSRPWPSLAATAQRLPHKHTSSE